MEKIAAPAYALVNQRDVPAMGQLLLMLIVPPIVGVATYAVFRVFSQSNRGGEAIGQRRHDPSAPNR